MGKTTRLGWSTMALVLTIAVARPAVSGTGIVYGCIGDCDGDGTVTVSEVLRGVRIALELSLPEVCPAARALFADQSSTLVTAVLNALDGCEVVHDFGDFERFSLRREGHYGFCPPPDTVYDGSIERRPDGSYVVATSRLEPGESGIDACLPGVVHCLVRRPQPCRILTAAEVERVRAAFSAITVYRGPDAACLTVFFDPCLITGAQWDEVRASDFECTGSHLDHDVTQALSELLESLDAGAETVCDEDLRSDGARQRVLACV